MDSAHLSTRQPERLRCPSYENLLAGVILTDDAQGMMLRDREADITQDRLTEETLPNALKFQDLTVHAIRLRHPRAT
jgi:hypothetical protein